MVVESWKTGVIWKEKKRQWTVGAYCVIVITSNGGGAPCVRAIFVRKVVGTPLFCLVRDICLPVYANVDNVSSNKKEVFFRARSNKWISFFSSLLPSQVDWLLYDYTKTCIVIIITIIITHIYFTAEYTNFSPCKHIVSQEIICKQRLCTPDLFKVKKSTNLSSSNRFFFEAVVERATVTTITMMMMLIAVQRAEKQHHQ